MNKRQDKKAVKKLIADWPVERLWPDCTQWGSIEVILAWEEPEDAL